MINIGVSFDVAPPALQASPSKGGSIDVRTSYERKQQTVAAFIDISGVTLQVVRFLFRSLWRKELVIFGGGRECMKLIGYKGLPQGPILYNIIGSCVDRFIPSGCGFLQFADYLVVYVANRLLNVARGLVQTAFTSLNIFSSSMGLTISASK
jgi:hypothetical protein